MLCLVADLCCFACSELQTEALRQQSFEQKCESWMSFLQRMEDSLAVDVAGSYIGLRQQLCIHKVSYVIINRLTDRLNKRTLRCNPDLFWCFSASRQSCPLVTRSFIQSSQKRFICCRKERWRTGRTKSQIKRHFRRLLLFLINLLCVVCQFHT